MRCERLDWRWYLIIVFSIHIISFNTFAQTDSTKNNKKYTRWIAPASLMVSSVALYKNGVYDRFDIQKRVQKSNKGFHTNADFILQGVPYIIGYGMYICGEKGKSDFLNKGILLVKSQVLANAVTYGLKYTLNVQRPDSSDLHSFPSGHTTRAFAAATWLHYEYGKKYPLISVLGFTVASSVGVLRVINNEHWASDVLAGAAIGIAATHLTYITHRYRFGTKGNGLSVVPYYGGKNGGIALFYKL